MILPVPRPEQELGFALELPDPLSRQLKLRGELGERRRFPSVCTGASRATWARSTRCRGQRLTGGSSCSAPSLRAPGGTGEAGAPPEDGAQVAEQAGATPRGAAVRDGRDALRCVRAASDPNPTAAIL